MIKNWRRAGPMILARDKFEEEIIADLTNMEELNYGEDEDVDDSMTPLEIEFLRQEQLATMGIDMDEEWFEDD
jgi:uncharacterized protein YgfB (UPF0149 family)